MDPRDLNFSSIPKKRSQSARMRAKQRRNLPNSPGQLKKYIRRARYPQNTQTDLQNSKISKTSEKSFKHEKLNARSFTNLNKNLLKHRSYGWDWDSIRYQIERGEFMGVEMVAKRPETHGLRIAQTTMERAKENLNKRPDYKRI